MKHGLIPIKTIHALFEPRSPGGQLQLLICGSVYDDPIRVDRC